MARQVVTRLRSHQEKALRQCLQILRTSTVCYLAGDVRTGKTLVALHASVVCGERVLFVTKKMAIAGIEKQYKESGLAIHVTVTNYERLHYLEPDTFDCIIVDEAHTLGAFPKPAQRARLVRWLHSGVKCILLSGTPSPESYSQMFHQLWATRFTPWAHYTNFYKWARDFVHVKKMYFSGLPVNDYSNADWTKLRPILEPIMVTMTQKDAGFKGQVTDMSHVIPIHSATREIIKAVIKTGVFEDRHLNLTALSMAQRMSFVHQLCSGTVIDSEGKSYSIDRAKVNYILKTWPKGRLAIFYCYVQEGIMLREMFPHNTNNPEEFARDHRLTFICQIKSGQEGTDLRCADHLIFYNISYSASSYFQARARQQHQQAGNITVHWLFSDYGFEQKIYNLIHNGKKKFTLSHFRKDYSIPDGPQITFRGMASH